MKLVCVYSTRDYICFVVQDSVFFTFLVQLCFILDATPRHGKLYLE